MKNENLLKDCLIKYKNKPTKQIINKIHIEAFEIDILKLIQNNYRLEDERVNKTYILFDYKDGPIERSTTQYRQVYIRGVIKFGHITGYLYDKQNYYKKSIKVLKKLDNNIYRTSLYYFEYGYVIDLRHIFRGILFILAGVIIAVVSSSLISNYLYLLFNIINYDRITMDDFRMDLNIFKEDIWNILYSLDRKLFFIYDWEWQEPMQHF